MNSLERKFAFEARKIAFLSRNKGKMRKPQRFSRINAVCNVPDWLVRELGDEINDMERIGRYIEIGIENSLGLPRMVSVNEETEQIKFCLKGEIAREIKAWAGKRRASVQSAIVELIKWALI